MTEYFAEDEDFKKKNFTGNSLPKGEYDNCSFTGCVFTEADLSGYTFSECDFTDCELSNVYLRGTSFRDVVFTNCKMLGLHFEECNPFLLTFRFSNCILNLSSFYKLKLKGIYFSNCKMEQVDFTEADLSKGRFSGCDLGGSIFSSTNLEGADLETATGFSIDPEENRIRKAIFSKENIHGLLDKYRITIK